MNDIELIDKILNSKKPLDIFTSSNWKVEFIKFSKLIHPDRCVHPRASDAMSILNTYKDLLTYGVEYEDECGVFNVFDDRIEYVITDDNRDLLLTSLKNYSTLMKLNDSASLSFKKYLPNSIEILNNKFIIRFVERSVPLTHKTLPQYHVNWIFSRMFEFSVWMSRIGYSHMGINPTSVFVIPKTHGIIVTSFYYMKKIGSVATTISAKYKNWYPTAVFTNKTSTSDVDLELSKKIAIYLLGDKSASGVVLRKNSGVNQNVLNFLLTKHRNEFSEYDEYRKLLKSNFDTRFYELTL